jgi:hypothetical protein
VNRIEEERSRVLALFDDQARSLRRLVTFFLAPALLFGVLIFLPFTQQITSSSRIEERLDTVRSLLVLKADTLAEVSAVDFLAEALRLPPRLLTDLNVRQALWSAAMDQAVPGEEEVGDWGSGRARIDLQESPELRALFPQNRGASPCIWLDDARWRDCFDVAPGTSLCVGRGCLIYPDMRTYIPGGPDGLLDRELAHELIDSLSVVQRAIREEIASLARLMEGAAESAAYDAGFRHAYEALEGFRSRVRERQRGLEGDIDQLSRDRAVLEADLETANRLIDAIESSGGAFETPLGPLPVGIRELVFLYPTILGVAYLLCLTAFLRMILLRRGYHDLGRRLHGTGAGGDEAYLALTMPLWYDPLRGALPQVGRALIAIVPLTFLIWSYVALKSGLAGVVSTSESRFGRQWYEAFLLLTLLGIAVMTVRVITALVSYARSGSALPEP